MTEIPTELSSVWHVSDELWQRLQMLLLQDSPPKRTGRKRADWRGMIEGIVYRVQTGCKWNKLPRQFGDDSTVHRWYQRWCKSGAMQSVWSAIVDAHPELGSLQPEWPVARPAAVAQPVAPITALEPAIAATIPVSQPEIAPHTVAIAAGTTGPVTSQPTIAQPAHESVPEYKPQIAAETQQPIEETAETEQPVIHPIPTEEHRRAA